MTLFLYKVSGDFCSDYERPSKQLSLHCKEDSNDVFPDIKLRGLVPNFHIHTSVIKKNKHTVKSTPAIFAKNLKTVILIRPARMCTYNPEINNVKNQVFIIFEYIFIVYCRRLQVYTIQAAVFGCYAPWVQQILLAESLTRNTWDTITRLIEPKFLNF